MDFYGKIIRLCSKTLSVNESELSSDNVSEEQEDLLISIQVNSIANMLQIMFGENESELKLSAVAVCLQLMLSLGFDDFVKIFLNAISKEGESDA